MYGIDLLVKEHKNIIRFTELLRQRCCAILEGGEVNILQMHEFISFGRNYADIHHHGKEEKILFHIMSEYLGSVAEKLIRNGMLVEHDLGRYHVGEWENALIRYGKNPSTEEKLSIITNAAAYADLLKRHIEKEDHAVYTFALRELKDEYKNMIEEQTVAFEQTAQKEGIQEKYTAWLHKMEQNS